MLCAYCKKSIHPTLFENGKISRQEQCPHCLAELHSCKMCSLYDVSYARDCKELMAEKVYDKQKANFCDYFQINGGIQSALSPEEEKKLQLEKAKSLFK